MTQHRAMAAVWLLLTDRELHRVHKTRPAPWPRPGGHELAEPSDACVLCGSRVGPRSLWTLSRKRGTLLKAVLVHRVHKPCLHSWRHALRAEGRP